jgi:transcriptional regulator with XRE-family HTH domain
MPKISAHSAPDIVLQRLLDYLREKLRERLKTTSQKDLAAEIGCTQGAISHWLQGVRGEKVQLISAIKMLAALGVPMENALKIALDDEDAASVLTLLTTNPDALRLVLRVLSSGGPEAEKLLSEAKYLDAKLEKK